mmetsp:Transcript_21810/g.19872  ORF Transcript_21810/g.19872 Transcript_21810/m.19872 type:complete len:550 (+) Transcript_21810:21-1670(+)
MDDLFSSLTKGTKFNKKKHSNEINLFQNNSNGNKKRKLDFFNTKTENNTSISKNNSNLNKDDDDCDTIKLEAIDEINAFRNRLQIKVTGTDIAKPNPTFNEMEISNDIKSIILRNIESSDWKEPTPIQMQAIPSLLLGRDVLATAPTGSGKTAAYVIPVLSKLKGIQKGGIRTILIAPTKELAEQIHREVLRLSNGKKLRICLIKKSIYTTAINSQDKTILGSYDLIVSTPMRLISLIRANSIDLSKVDTIILDEVDKLFDIGSGVNNELEDNNDDTNTNKLNTRSSFLTQIDEIFHTCSNKSLQIGLFSATTSPFVQELASTLLKSPLHIRVGIENSGASTIEQKLVFVGREDGKLLGLRQLIQKGIKPPVLLFLQNKERAKELFKELVYDGINVDVIHSERSQQQREDIIKRFRLGEIWVLICTDLMARGVDFKGINMVINYDLPQSAVSYIHRIGRTGRAGNTGEAITFFTEDDISIIRPIVNVMKLSGCEVPEWLLHVKQLSSKEKKSLRLHAPERKTISTLPKYTKTNKNKKYKNQINENVESD